MDALSSQVYAIQLPPHLLAQPHAPAPFLPEDIHICGNCKQSFTDIRYFLQHKNECNAFLSSATAALLESASPPVNLQMLSEQPLLQVMINEENQPVIIQQSHNDNNELNSNSESNATNALTAAATLLQCGNVHVNGTRRDIQIDEEDVASLLANQFAKEAVYIPPDSPANDNPESIVGDIYVEDKDTSTEPVDVNGNDPPTDYIQESTVDIVHNVLDDNLNNNNNNNNSNENSSKKSSDNSKNNTDVSNQNNDSSNDTNTKSGQQINIDNIHLSGMSQPSILPPKRLTYCNVCSFVTMYPSDLTRHMRKHTGERPFACSVCSQRFPRRDKLQTHLRIHTGEKPYRCQFCDYAAIDSGPLRKHLRTHTDERPFKCQFCPYSAKDTSQLTVHLRTHTGDAPFICQVEKCGRAFKTSTDLKRHGTVHKKVHPFACKQCDYKASNKPTLEAHYQLSHSDTGCDIDSLKCNISNCDFKSLNEKDLESHKQRLHLGSLKQHMRKQHASGSSGGGSGGNVKVQARPMCQKTHLCGFCPAAFVRQDSLRSHLKQHQANNNGDKVSSTPVSKDVNKSYETAVSSAELVANSTFFIEDIIEDEYINI
ncbi:uncharacterized protein LOC142319330 isoform X2 [Lycorma delicatula]|uniref:uncharacterized protein LOC142319330 isoform X2 n=1 Tax=Lycorma delicatula TaxID=130591 RepID=UPI003F50F92D